MKPELLVPIILGVCQAIQAGLPSQFKKFVPLAAVAIGAGVGHFLLHDVVEGVIVGLSAVGLYSGTKNTLEGFQQGDDV